MLLGVLPFITRKRGRLPQHRLRALESPEAPGIEREQLLASLLVMAWMIAARDPYTGGHLWRVPRYAALLCKTAGVPMAQRARIAIGGFLHDLGRVGVPDAILRKPGKVGSITLQATATTAYRCRPV